MTLGRLINCIVVFISSIYLCFTLLILERLFGLGWDYHPDAVHYIENSSTYVKNVLANESILSYLNNGYYFLTNSVSSNRLILLLINIFFYSFTNVILFCAFSDFSKYLHKNKNSLIFYFVAVCIIFDPYRMHLSISILKDTIIIFLVILFIVSRGFSQIFVLVGGMFMRQSFLANLIIYAPKYIIIFSIIIFCILFFYYAEIINNYLLLINNVDMNMRSFDNIPNFFQDGIFGVWKRAVIWPAIYLSGAFVIISASPFLIPIAVQVLSIISFRLLYLRSNILNYKMLILLALVAIPVSGFTAYVRYAMPILILFLLNDMKNIQKSYESSNI